MKNGVESKIKRNPKKGGQKNQEVADRMEEMNGDIEERETIVPLKAL